MKKIKQALAFALVGSALIPLFQNFSDTSSSASTKSSSTDVKKFSFSNGSEFPGASGKLSIAAPTSGDSIIILKYDFTHGGNYVASSLPLTTPVSGDTVRFKMNVPLQSVIYLRVTDESKQTLQFVVNHSTLLTDDTGWTTVEVPVTSSESFWGDSSTGKLKGRIISLSLGIGNTKRNPENTIGQGLFRQVQVFNKNRFSPTTPSASFSAIHFNNGAEFPGAQGSIEVIAPTQGDSLQTVAYDFTRGGNYVSSRMQLAAPVDGHYVRFAFKADANVLIGVRVTDESGQTLQKIISRASLPMDAYGWSTATVDMESSNSFWQGAKTGKLQGRIQSLGLLVDHGSAKGVSGVAYFRQVEVLNFLPSMYNSTVVPKINPLRLAAFSNGAEFPGATGSMGIASDNGDYVHKIDFNLKAGNYVADVMTLATPVIANEVRFLAKIPTGLDIAIRVMDSAGQSFQTNFISRQFDSINDDNWRSYVVPLGAWAFHFGGANDGAFKGSVTQVKIILDRGPQGKKNSKLSVLPSGTFYVRGLSLGVGASTHLDLKPNTIVYPALGKANSDPTLTTGVSYHSRVEASYKMAEEIGFKYARTDITWNGVESVKGTYTTKGIVSSVAGMHAHGLTPVLIFDYSNKNYPPVGDYPIDLAAFQKYVAAVTTALKGQNVVYEVWNEQDLWGFTAPQYAKLLAATADTVHAIDPERRVIAGGLAGANFSYIYRTLAEKVPRNVAAFTIHPYTRNDPEQIADKRAAIKDMIASFGINSGLATTEVGASSYWYDAVDPKSETAESYHATTITRQILTSWASGELITLIYQLQDAPFDPSKPKPQEFYFGLTGPRMEAKPAKNAVQLLLHSARVRKYQGVVSGSKSGLQAMKFTSPQQETMYVVWNNIRNTTVSFTAINDCDKSIDFTGAKASKSTSCVIDHQSEALPCIKNGNGTVTCSITERQGPVFVRMKR
ncbi:MAG: hypothetical protein J7501_06900 [Bdellovibrio sp.]|nr:hypothetical protein [Bdellovibrio sp.]